jgi:hypothetical protein
MLLASSLKIECALLILQNVQMGMGKVPFPVLCIRACAVPAADHSDS